MDDDAAVRLMTGQEGEAAGEGVEVRDAELRDLLVCMERKWLQRCLVAVTAMVALAVFVVALWRVPWWLDDHYLTKPPTSAQATIVSGMRTALVALGAGALAVAGLFYTHHTLHVAREGHITDRITKAVEQLGSAVIEVRLGGIYALERIMRDSAKDHYAVVQVLAAFVREHGRSKPPASTANRSSVSAGYHRVERARRRLSQPDQAPGKPAEDVQAALTVLAQRPEGRPEPDRINLSGAYLSGARLKGANLKRANLKGTNLEFAVLYDAHLERAQLYNAMLRDANLSNARLQHADLAHAHMPRTELYGAFLECANLWGTELEEAKGLEVEQVVAARPAYTTQLPADLAGNRQVQERITRYNGTSHECNPMHG
ncbi:pentapeptide repeat-containing protein [Streptomyces sp. NPDC048558]|uniref:pentapeptide repeat-containing protein n=1 Tax=Streptomyces sp. NPDC048558 TaxID=3155759 RepID=UPI0034210D2B